MSIINRFLTRKLYTPVIPVLNVKEIKLGMEGRDKITGFEGIITSKVVYLTGCAQFGVTPKCDKDGKVVIAEYFDESRLEVIGNGILNVAAFEDTKDLGGPNRDVPRK